MSKPAVLKLDDKEYVFPTIEGVENEKAVDFRTLRSTTGYISYDEGYGNTGSCQSEITYIDGEVGILRYRGIPIEQLADKSNFLESSYMILYGDLPTQSELDQFTSRECCCIADDERRLERLSSRCPAYGDVGIDARGYELLQCELGYQRPSRGS